MSFGCWESKGLCNVGGQNKSHMAIMEMLRSLGCETQMARDLSQSPSQQTFLTLAQSVVSVLSLSVYLRKGPRAS